jgi:hypothetical protein
MDRRKANESGYRAVSKLLAHFATLISREEVSERQPDMGILIWQFAFLQCW